MRQTRVYMKVIFIDIDDESSEVFELQDYEEIISAQRISPNRVLLTFKEEWKKGERARCPPCGGTMRLKERLWICGECGEQREDGRWRELQDET